MVFKGNGVVWDAEKGKALCRFEHGVLETNDSRVIDKLLELGYETGGVVIQDVEYREVEEAVEEVVEEVEVVEDIKNYEEMTNKELKAILEAKGYMNLDRKTKKQLLTMLEGD